MNKVIKHIDSENLKREDITEITIEIPKNTKAMVVTYLYGDGKYNLCMLTSTIPSEMIIEAVSDGK